MQDLLRSHPHVQDVAVLLLEGSDIAFEGRVLVDVHREQSDRRGGLAVGQEIQGSPVHLGIAHAEVASKVGEHRLGLPDLAQGLLGIDEDDNRGLAASSSTPACMSWYARSPFLFRRTTAACLVESTASIF